MDQYSRTMEVPRVRGLKVVATKNVEPTSALRRRSVGWESSALSRNSRHWSVLQLRLARRLSGSQSGLVNVDFWPSADGFAPTTGVDPLQSFVTGSYPASENSRRTGDFPLAAEHDELAHYTCSATLPTGRLSTRRHFLAGAAH